MRKKNKNLNIIKIHEKTSLGLNAILPAFEWPVWSIFT